MEIPLRLDAWDASTVQSLLAEGVFESDSFDFKERLPERRDEAGKSRLRKTIVGFANSGGGFLIFGVSDDRSAPAEKRLVGFDPAFEFPREFGNYPSSCSPSVDWRFLPISLNATNSGRMLHVVEILSTWKRPHAVLFDGVAAFVKRTNKGDEQMSYAEIKSAFQEAEYRRGKLALLISEIDHMRETAARLLASAGVQRNVEVSPDQAWTWSTRYSTTLLDIVLGDSFSFLAGDPEVWRLMCSLREKARLSNALGEAFASAVFFRFDSRVGIDGSRLGILFDAASAMVAACNEVEPRLKKMLSC